MLTRPYHKGSMLGPAPAQTLLGADKIAEWMARVRAYWPRTNAKAGEVARALVSFIGPDGQIMPALTTLAETIKITERTVRRWIEAMEGVGFLKKIRRRTMFGQTSNGYLLLLPDDEPPAGQQPVVGNCPSIDSTDDSHLGESMDSLPRPALLRRLNTWLGQVVEAVRPEPQAPRFTVEQQIALLTLYGGSNTKDIPP